MDVHIHMSYCTPCGFKILAYNYLGINCYCSFSEIEEVTAVVEVTPAEIAEELMNPRRSLEVVEELKVPNRVVKEKSNW